RGAGRSVRAACRRRRPGGGQEAAKRGDERCGSSGATPKKDNRLMRTSRSASPRARSATRTARRCSGRTTWRCRNSGRRSPPTCWRRSISARPARLKKVEEETVPSWLWRSAADSEALELLDEQARTIGETSAKQVFDRLAGTWTYWGWKGGYFDSEADARAFFDELRFMLAMQM